MKVMIIRFGKPHHKRQAIFDLDQVIFAAADSIGMSKSEAKRYINQNAVYITFHPMESEEKLSN